MSGSQKNKDSVINIRITNENKELFTQICKDLGQNPSSILSKFIDNFIISHTIYDYEEPVELDEHGDPVDDFSDDDDYDDD